jgi:hypothetical protein
VNSTPFFSPKKDHLKGKTKGVGKIFFNQVKETDGQNVFSG